MEKSIEEIKALLESENIDDKKLGIILAAKTNYPIDDFNYWYGEQGHFREFIDIMIEYTDVIQPVETCIPHGSYNNDKHKWITKWK